MNKSVTKRVVNKTVGQVAPANRPAESIGLLIGVLARSYRKVIDKQMEALGIPASEWLLLLNLWHHEGSTQQELADILQMTRGGMNKLLNRLEQAGYLRREEGFDQRSKRIFLEEKARPLILQMDLVQEKVIAASLEGISGTEEQLIKELLRRVQTNVDKM